MFPFYFFSCKIKKHVLEESMKSLNEIRESAIRCTEEENKINKIVNLKKELIKEIDEDRDVFLYYLNEFRRKTIYEDIAPALTIISLYFPVLTMSFFNGVKGLAVLLVIYLLLLSSCVLLFMFNVNKYRIFGVVLEEIDKKWDMIEWPKNK